MAGSAGYNAWKLVYELSPIIFVGGVANFVPFKMLPIITFTEAVNLATGLLSQPDQISLDNCFAHYQPLPGASMIDQDIARYPFANQQTAANSTMTKPLAISYQMVCPARGPLAMITKLPTMMALQKMFETHNRSGGMYHCITPSFVYLNCIMRSMRDSSSAGTKQVQTSWVLEFEKPLLTLEDAQAASGQMNSLLNAATGNQQVIGTDGGLPTSGLQTPTVNVAGAPGTGSVVPIGLNQTPLPAPAQSAPAFASLPGIGITPAIPTATLPGFQIPGLNTL